MKVLMPTYGGGHVALVIPLAEELLRRGHEVLILPLSVAELAVSRTALPYLTMPQALQRVYREPELTEVLTLGERMAEQYHNPESGLSRESTAAYYGVSMHCLLQEHGEAAWELFREQGRGAFCPQDFMQRLIALEHPDIVTASCYVRMEKAGLLAARAMHVHSLLIWDTIDHPVWHSCVDHQTTFNELQRSSYIAAGYAPERVFAGGQPAFDALFEAGADRAAELTALGLDPGKKTVLWAADGSPWVMAAFREVQRAIAALPEYNFIVKLHPTSNDERNFPLDAPNAIVLKRYDINRLLNTADLVVSQISTVLQQAMILEKKVLSLRVYGSCPESEWAPWREYYPPDMLRHVSEEGALPEVIRESLNAPRSEAPYEENRALYRPLRNGAKNICGYMESMCQIPVERF